MRKLICLFVLLFFTQAIYGQILHPAKWSYSVSVQNAEIGEEVEIVFVASIDLNWDLYSSDNTLDPGPLPAVFEFEKSSAYEVVGDIKPVGAKKKFDSIFEGDVTYFSGKAEFRQKVKILAENPVVKGTFSYQVCSDLDGKCIPFDEEFKVPVTTKGASSPIIQTTTIEIPVAAADSIPRSEKATIIKSEDTLLNSRDTFSPYSLLSFMIVAFLAGLAALFTPCVFPMIPMTVTFFTGKAKSRKHGIRNALFYGFSIIAIYTLIGSLVAPFMGPEMANELATNWILNVLFFVVFVVFAISFFGMFEITLPNAWVNKVDQQADKGGFAGIFFMAFTLVLVSFSCTGPIVGSILVQAAGGQILKPILGMFAFSMAFAVPFTLFAIFPEWLNSLPKSGGWLNSVKVVLGFLELALALKFLSIADQAYHWNLLDREIYLAAWIVIFFLLGLYLLGKIRLPNDSPSDKISVPQLVLAIVVLSFVVYLIPGMFGAPLKALSGYLPPISTLDFNLSAKVTVPTSLAQNDKENLCEKPKYADLLHFPHEMKGYFDYQQALACAIMLNKPLFIDFTGHGCVNCREMEARVWSDPEVLKRLTSDFVVVALYVDDKTKLPTKEWYVSEYDKKEKKSIGQQNADFQIRRFNNNAQPYYVILGQNEELLVEPRAYDLSIPGFIEFLDRATAAFATQVK